MKYAVIVDAYSTGQYLAPLLRGFNYRCIHIQSSLNMYPKIYEDYHRNQFHFEKNIIFEGNIDTLIAQLSKYDIKFILPGCDAGIVLADCLNHHIQLPANDFNLIQARRDKFLMQQTLMQHNIMSIKQLKSNNIQEILTWVDSNTEFPIVVKPLASTGSDGVFICNTTSDIRNAVNNILHQPNIFGETNSDVLVQEFISGVEYIVNTVSYNGTVFVTDMLRSQRPMLNNALIYDCRELISHEDPDFKMLGDYIQKVLFALGIRYGAAHSEVIIRENGEIVLIETNTRLAGSIDPSAFTEALGYTQISLLIESLINPEHFLRLVNLPRLALRQQLTLVYLISSEKGIIKKQVNLDELMQVTGFYNLKTHFTPGRKLAKTVDVFTTPGFVYLVAQQPQQIEQGKLQIRHIETSFYKNIIEKTTHGFQSKNYARLRF